MNQEVKKIVESIKNKVGNVKPKIAIILGASFGDFLDEIKDKKEISFADIKGLNVIASDITENKLIFGSMFDKEICVMFGRLHYNLGYKNSDIANSIFMLKELGCERLIITSSVGAIDKKIKVGDLVTFEDQINLTGRNPLYGCVTKKAGDCFIDMTKPYDEEMINNLFYTAKHEMAIKLKKAVFIEFPGPTAETISEVKFATLIGGGVIGFNICNEVIAAKYCELPTICYSLVTNYASAFTSNLIKHEDIVYNRKCASNYYLELLARFIKNLD